MLRADIRLDAATAEPTRSQFQHDIMQRRRRIAAVICVCAATSTAALAAPRRRCDVTKPEDAPSALRRAQLAVAAAAALPAKPASAAPPAPEVATDRKGVPISKATWEAAHTPGAADLVWCIALATSRRLRPPRAYGQLVAVLIILISRCRLISRCLFNFHCHFHCHVYASLAFAIGFY